jgi:hypothetical protein
MKAMGVTIVILGLLMTISASFNLGPSDKGVSVAPFEALKQNHTTLNWRQNTGIEVIILGGVLFAVSKKKELAARHG